MKIAFFGSSLVSAYWNGAATYYRGLLRALHDLGWDITFYEPDARERQAHRDIDDPPWARVVVYANREDAMRQALASTRGVDVIVKASGVGVFDRELEASVLDRPSGTMAIYWDVDAPATLDRLRADPQDPFHRLVGRYDCVLTGGGGGPVASAYKAIGARECMPIYNALDPATHYPVGRDPRFDCDVAFLGNRLPDREARVDEFFFGAARQLSDHHFLLAGNGWNDKPRPANVTTIGHVYTTDHNAFNCTPLTVLNISRASMACYGYSPAPRVFEAAGAGACLISDVWEGLDAFLEPGREVLAAASGEDVAEHVRRLTPERARAIGEAARRRVLASHTYAHRAADVDAILQGRSVAA
ncbi:MAG TPA: glycosyltransferase [Vicinamibacterales bacterium]|nr:glycosyltransferase [Vicinamibacterales bacterium]